MKKNKPIIIAGGILIFLVLIYLITLITKSTPDTTIKKLTDEEMFYRIQETISNYIIHKDYTSPNYTLKNVYYVKDDITTYYHANGYIVDYVMEDYTYQKDVNFLLVVKGNSYNIYELTSSQKETYLDELNKESYTFTNGMILEESSFTEESKLDSYISEFITLLSVDNTYAYQLLTTDMKNKYSSYRDFSNKAADIFDRLDTTVKRFNKYSQDDATVYKITTENGNTITIYETSIMDYKIEY